MLNIRTVYRVRRTVDYYLRKAEGRSPGIWLGAGCAALGVNPGSAVTRRNLALALDGYSATGEALVHVLPKNRRCGYDIVLSCTKSVSMAAVSGEPKLKGIVLSVINRLIRRFVGWIESLVRSRGEKVRGAPLAVACFRHDFSRMGDEHLHVHFMVMNLTGGSAESVRAIEVKGCFKNHLPLERRFQQSLAKMLRRRGLDARLDLDGRAVLRVKDELCRISSGMRSRIDLVAEKFRHVDGKERHKLRAVIADRLARVAVVTPNRVRPEISLAGLGLARKRTRPFSRKKAFLRSERAGWEAAREVLRENPRFSLSLIWGERRRLVEARRRAVWMWWAERVTADAKPRRRRKMRKAKRHHNRKQIVTKRFKIRKQLSNATNKTSRKTL